MPYVPPTTDQLLVELTDKVQSLPSFTDNSFASYSFDDNVFGGNRIPMPFCVITYEGCNPVTDEPSHHNTRSSSLSRANAIVLNYSILVGHDEQQMSETENMRVLTDLLSSIRASIIGYKGVNNRPWVFAGESPVPFTPIQGTIWYGQEWQTTVIYTSNPNA